MTLGNPLDYMVHGTLQARILEWVTFPFSRGSSQPRDRTQVSRSAGRFFTSWATREAQWSGRAVPSTVVQIPAVWLWQAGSDRTRTCVQCPGGCGEKGHQWPKARQGGPLLGKGTLDTRGCWGHGQGVSDMASHYWDNGIVTRKILRL